MKPVGDELVAGCTADQAVIAKANDGCVVTVGGRRGVLFYNEFVELAGEVSRTVKVTFQDSTGTRASAECQRMIQDLRFRPPKN